MNEVTLQYLDKETRSATIRVNDKPIAINFIQIYKNETDFNGKQGYSCQAANDWNMSNPLIFEAATIKGLVGQIKRHKYNLVPFRI